MRKQQEIKTVSYVHVGDKLVCTDDLTPEQKVRLGTWLKTTYLNNLYRGQAVFKPAAGE
ncbi:MAG: hypothetical protein HDT15_04385 [Oscillibacter sp.]|nr:hypothetical protein [Oscillibacter sp.]